MCYCTALTEQKQHFMATQSTNHSTLHWLFYTKTTEVTKKNHFGLRIFGHSSEELVVQAAAQLQQWLSGCGGEDASLQDGNYDEFSKAGLSFISVSTKAMERCCPCPANTLLVCHEHRLCLVSHTETTLVPMSTGQEILHSTKPVQAHC